MSVSVCVCVYMCKCVKVCELGVGTGNTQSLGQPGDTSPPAVLRPHAALNLPAHPALAGGSRVPGPGLRAWLSAKPHLSSPPENLGAAPHSQIFAFSAITNYSSTSSHMAMFAIAIISNSLTSYEH